MDRPQLVISVCGGVVDGVLTNIADLDVTLVDFDVSPADRDAPGVFDFRWHGRDEWVFVGPLSPATLPGRNTSIVGRALYVADVTLAREPYRWLQDRELATVLAALRYWQRDLEDDEDDFVFGSEHFAEHSPLASPEIDDLCERLNGPAASVPRDSSENVLNHQNPSGDLRQHAYA